jgi:predicted CoA-substrate-specific enzyme activase
MYYVGVDVGASRTKVAIIDEGQALVGFHVRRSGTDFQKSSLDGFSLALKEAGLSEETPFYCISTGYGRKNVSFAHETKTEISCHSKACFHFFPGPITVIDIGGQDNKVIKLDERGRRVSFKMNRKCAAGTGAFLEEMSMRLQIQLEEMDRLARDSKEMVELGSYCTVFSATEVLEKIRQGKKVEDLVKGLFFSVIKRVLEMDSLTEKVVMTGGVVAHNPYLVEMMREVTKKEVLVPPHPQLAGAFGAGLFAWERFNQNHKEVRDEE